MISPGRPTAAGSPTPRPPTTSSTRSRFSTSHRARSSAITSDRYNSENPAWSTDGKWLYFLSDRNLKTTIHSPWGPRQPEPHFDRTVKIYELALTAGLRSPFLPPDELHPDDADKEGRRKARRRQDKDEAQRKAHDDKTRRQDKTDDKNDRRRQGREEAAPK